MPAVVAGTCTSCSAIVVIGEPLSNIIEPTHVVNHVIGYGEVLPFQKPFVWLCK